MSPPITRASLYAGTITQTRPVGGSECASDCPNRSVGTTRTERSTPIHTRAQTTIVAVDPKLRVQASVVNIQCGIVKAFAPIGAPRGMDEGFYTRRKRRSA